jgi:hypothetical protein
LPDFALFAVLNAGIEELHLDSKAGNALKRAGTPISGSVSGFRDGLQQVLLNRPQPTA